MVGGRWEEGGLGIGVNGGTWGYADTYRKGDRKGVAEGADVREWVCGGDRACAAELAGDFGAGVDGYGLAVPDLGGAGAGFFQGVF